MKLARGITWRSWPPLLAPGYGLGAPFKSFPLTSKIFQWKCPLQNENGLALLTCSKMKFQACTWMILNRIIHSGGIYSFVRSGWVSL